MSRLLELLEKYLGGSWRDTIEQLRDANALEDIADRLHRGDVAGAVQGVEDAAAAFVSATQDAFDQGAEAAAKWLTSETGGAIRYDEENKHAVAWADDNSAELVREVTAEQKDMIRRVVRDGVAAGKNPREVARDIRDSIGLTDYQAQIVANYRKALESGDWADALGRELTHGGDDRMVQRAAAADKPLSQGQIDKAVDRYRANWVAFRAETIARTEGLRTLHAGTNQLFRQAIDNGDVDADSLTRQWNHASRGKNSRDTHEAIDGERRGVDEAFSIGLMYPGDPDADPSDTINCRCVLSTRLDLSEKRRRTGRAA